MNFRHTRVFTPSASSLLHVERLTNLGIFVSRVRPASIWTSERILLVDPSFPRERLRGYLPDALWITEEGVRIFIEYERTRKSNPRVRQKIEVFDLEMARVDRFMDFVLWIVELDRLESITELTRLLENQDVRTLAEFEREISGRKAGKSAYES